MADQINSIISPEAFEQADQYIEKMKALKQATDEAYESLYKLNAVAERAAKYADYFVCALEQELNANSK